MAVISWLAGRFGLVRREEFSSEVFAKVELQKQLTRLQNSFEEMVDVKEQLVGQLAASNRHLSQMEETAAHEHELAQNAVARVEDLRGEIAYLKQQVELYQRRLGLLPQERQGTSDEKALRPLKPGREPFAIVAARIQSQRTEEYWKQRAAAVEAGTTGSTTDNSPTDTKGDDVGEIAPSSTVPR